MSKEYKISVDTRILELLGPNLYTNIYYILAELIANAYDADAHNVYLIEDRNSGDIIVEDDGRGMSYENGDIKRYLNVAKETRTSEEDSKTPEGRMKMGRKGVGKLAALSVAEKVLIKTICNGEKSGFVLSRTVGEDNLLEPLPEDKIEFKKISQNGTSVVMQNPQYKMHKTLAAIKRNLLKIFPLVGADFKIHIEVNGKSEIIDNFDKNIISELSTLITLGDDYKELGQHFSAEFDDIKNDVFKNKEAYSIPVKLLNRNGNEKEYNLVICGWIGTYRSTKGRKAQTADFPDNFISLYANGKMGEFNILPIVGQNKLAEVYVVGQLHVDLFELTELPDMALSNRQGYKTDDKRYQEVINYVRKSLLPEILNMRLRYVNRKNRDKGSKKQKQQEQYEKDFREATEKFKQKTSEAILSEIVKDDQDVDREHLQSKIDSLINENLPQLGIKKKVDTQKRKILISHTYADKCLADVVYKMLLHNGFEGKDIIYTNCDDEEARIPDDKKIYDYLRTFFVDSYSDEKIFVIFITSEDMGVAWGAVVEVGAAWITQADHQIFNIVGFTPHAPLDDQRQWHTSTKDEDGNLCMDNINSDIFCKKIEGIADYFKRKKKSRTENKAYLGTLVSIV